MVDSTQNTDAAADDPIPTDLRLGALMDLTQGLITGYRDLATEYADAIPDPATRQRLMAGVEKTVAMVRSRYTDIALSKPQ